MPPTLRCFLLGYLKSELCTIVSSNFMTLLWCRALRAVRQLADCQSHRKRSRKRRLRRSGKRPAKAQMLGRPRRQVHSHTS